MTQLAYQQYVYKKLWAGEGAAGVSLEFILFLKRRNEDAVSSSNTRSRWLKRDALRNKYLCTYCWVTVWSYFQNILPGV